MSQHCNSDPQTLRFDWKLYLTVRATLFVFAAENTATAPGELSATAADTGELLTTAADAGIHGYDGELPTTTTFAGSRQSVGGSELSTTAPALDELSSTTTAADLAFWYVTIAILLTLSSTSP